MFCTCTVLPERQGLILLLSPIGSTLTLYDTVAPNSFCLFVLWYSLLCHNRCWWYCGECVWVKQRGCDSGRETTVLPRGCLFPQENVYLGKEKIDGPNPNFVKCNKFCGCWEVEWAWRKKLQSESGFSFIQKKGGGRLERKKVQTTTTTTTNNLSKTRLQTIQTMKTPACLHLFWLL